jgi:hypothetical protein
MTIKALTPAALLGALTFGLAGAASAQVRVAGGGGATLSAVEVALAQGPDGVTVTLSVQVDGKGGPVALLIPASALTPGSAAVLPDFKALDALLAATDPRLEVFAAREPCAHMDALYELDPELVPVGWAPRAAPGGAWTVAPVTEAWEAFEAAHRVKVDAKTRAALAPHRGTGGDVLALVGRLPPGRGQWLGPVTWRQPSAPRALPVGLAAEQLTPGRLLAVRLFTAHPSQQWSAVGEPAVDLPSGIHLPEVALEAPEDLARTAARHVVHRTGRGAVLRTFAGLGPEVPGAPPSALVARFELQLGPRDAARQLQLQTEVFKAPRQARWMFRRVWREPLSCPFAGRYRRIVEIQQQAEVSAYIALTGRPRQEILRQSVERGYAQRPDGTLGPVKPAPRR